MRKRMIIMIVCLVVVFGGIFGYKAFVNYQIGKALSNRQQPVVTVATAIAEKASWTPALRATGSLRAIQGVDVTTEVPGTVARIAFESGQRVDKGELLLALDASTEKAELAGLRAQSELARQTLERKRSLRKRGVGSQADLDQAQAEFDNARAAIGAKQAAINKKTIDAPFSGTVGLRQVDLGQYLAPGTPVVTLQTLDPIYLDFTLPQQQLATIHEGQTVELRIQGLEPAVFTGQIVAISPRVELGTRSFEVRAKLPNQDVKLRPGMFGSVRVVLDQSNDVVTVRQTAISYNPYGDTVFKVVQETPEGGGEPRKIVKRVNVRTGETRADQVQVLQGVEPGDEVVIAGQLKLTGDAPVKVDNSIVPEDKSELGDVENR